MTKKQKNSNVGWLVLFSSMGFFYRPYLGGSFHQTKRFIQILLLLAIVFAMYYVSGNMPTDKTSWIKFALVEYGFMRFWNHSHHAYFQVNVTVLDKRTKWVDWFLRVIYGEGKYFNWLGNVTGMFFSYLPYAIICSCFMPHWYFSLGSVVVATCYGLSGKLFPMSWYTKIAEFASGLFCFGLFYLALM